MLHALFRVLSFHRYHQDFIRHPALTTTGFDVNDGAHSSTRNQLAINVVGQSTNRSGSYPEEWTEGTAANKVVFLNTPPPPPQHIRSEKCDQI